MADIGQLELYAKYIRYHLVRMTTAAGSGHLSSSLSAVELMVGLLFSGVFRADLKKPEVPNNDRLVFSKGHAAPLLYALYAAAGALPTRSLMKLRSFRHQLEGHPMPSFRFTEAPTGSLGQGLSVALGQAIAGALDRRSYRVYCLLGDGEMAEGSVWEAIQLASHRQISNLVGIIDFNRLGQTGPTLFGDNPKVLTQRLRSFGWKTLVVDGHDLKQIVDAYQRAAQIKDSPVMIIGKTVKGKGVAIMENQNGWHGRVLTKPESKDALKHFGNVPQFLRAKVALPSRKTTTGAAKKSVRPIRYRSNESVSVRESLGRGLLRLAPAYPNLVVVDADVQNSTYASLFAAKFPRRFIQAFLAEQNAVAVATGLAKRGKLPVFPSFAAFLTRAVDQLRMQSYARVHAIYIGSHVGVAIGHDGPSQMGLSDIAVFRALEHSVILYPSDPVSAEKLLEQAIKAQGICYLRATRNALPTMYPLSRSFRIGGSHVLRRSKRDRVTIVAAGVTVPEALRAADILSKRRIAARVIDAYSIKPIDQKTLKTAARETKHLIVVEDAYPEGGIAEAVRSALGRQAGVVESMAVRKTPCSGQPAELMADQHIDATAIIKTIERNQQ